MNSFNLKCLIKNELSSIQNYKHSRSELNLFYIQSRLNKITNNYLDELNKSAEYLKFKSTKSNRSDIRMLRGLNKKDD